MRMMNGSDLNKALGLRGKHSLYSEDGKWYHHLKKFPGILFDKGGYIIFEDKSHYESNGQLQHKHDLHIKDGISSINGYKQFTEEEKRLLNLANQNLRNTMRGHMQKAIQVMRESVVEKRDDGKVSPKVGAVLLFPNGSIKTAHRGELRDGQHAEFTLLDIKCANKDLSKCILFATLEPCVERNPPKRGCCKRVIGARIKTVYVGIQDPDPTVAGEGIGLMESNGIKVIMFDRDLQKIIETENQDFLKQAYYRAEKAKAGEVNFTFKNLIPEVDFSQLSEEALGKFINQAKLNYEINNPDFQRYLADVGIMELDSLTQTYRPTGFGILLFGRNPRARFKQAVLKANVDYGSDKVEPKDFHQPLVLIPDLVEEWLLKVLPLSKDTSSFKRKDVPDFPLPILREAVINAIVHRDYNIDGAKSSLEIDNDKIVVKSPGGPVSSITIEQLNTFRAPSISRNPIITYIFSLMGYVEEKGFGMRAMRSINEKFGLPLPEYLLEDPFLTLTFPRNLQAVKRVTHIEGLENLNNEELAGFEFIKSKEVVTRKEYQDHFHFDSDKKAERHLRKMVDLQLIIRSGAGPNVSYMINPNKIATERPT